MLSQRTLAILFFMSQLLRGISPIWATDVSFKDSQSNAPTIVQAYQTVNGVDAALLQMVYGGYENGNGHLKYVRMSAFAGQTTLNPAATWQMDFCYVDELPSLYATYANEFVADPLLQSGANPLVHAKK